MLNLVKSFLILTLLSSSFHQTAFAGQREANLEISQEGKITLSGNSELPPPKEMEDGSVIMPEAKDYPSTVYFTLKKDTVLDCIAGYWTIRRPSRRFMQQFEDHSFMLVAVKGVEKGKINVLRIEDQYAIGYYFLHACEAQKHMKSDPEEAVKWFLRAAKNGHAGAQYFMGRCLQSGNGIEKNAPEAVKWFLKSAEQGNSDAQGMLGFAYVLGDGTPKDEVEAYAYFNLAAAKDEGYRKDVLRLESQITPDARFAGQQRSKQLLKEFESKKESLQRLLEEAKKNQDKKGA
jgi:hypothetical protein